MGAHFVDIPHGIFVTQMLVSWTNHKTANNRLHPQANTDNYVL